MGLLVYQLVLMDKINRGCFGGGGRGKDPCSHHLKWGKLVWGGHVRRRFHW